MEKIRLKTRVWMFIFLVIISIVWMYFDDSHITSDSVFTKRAWIGITILWGIFIIFVSGVIYLENESPQCINLHGHYSYRVQRKNTILVPRNKKGEQPCPDFKFFGIGAIMASGAFYGGKGENGWEWAWDIPGMVEEVGDSIAIHSEERVCYVGREQHEKLWFLYDEFKNYCDAKGLIMRDDTPIWVNWVPSKHISVPAGFREMLMDFKANAEMYGKNEAYYKAAIKERDIEDEGRRQKIGGKNWNYQLAPKDVEMQDQPKQQG